MEPEDKKEEEVVDEEVVDEEGAEGDEEEVKEKPDRPEANYKAELARKNAEIERLRAEKETERSRPKRDAADLTTWSDHELKAIKNSKDPSVAAYVDQAEDILLDRKVRAIRERERVQEKRAVSDVKLRQEFPEALDPTSEFAIAMERVMYEFDLDKTPSGRLAAAKIVASESKGKKKTSADADRELEASRIRDVKSNMVDGDRSKPSNDSKHSPKKIEELEKRIMRGDEKAVGEALGMKGIDYNKFFPKR
jgi:hypothetical protein